jgi:hypothetical protein
MPSTLDSSLVDDLIPTVDALRAELLPAFGVRAQRVFLLHRRWSGTERGEGVLTVLSEVEMIPPPLLTDASAKQRYELKSHGRDEEGELEASEISLTYTEGELDMRPVPPLEEFLWKVIDAHGQAQNLRYYVPAAPPRVDREDSIGWKVILKRADAQ